MIFVGMCVGSCLLWTNYHAQDQRFGDVASALRNQRHKPFHRPLYAGRPADGRIRPARRHVARSLRASLHAVGMFLRIPATVLIVVLAAMCTVRAAPSRYKRAFDLEGLMREQARTFPVTSSLCRAPAPAGTAGGRTLRPADYALTPNEWLRRFALDGQGRFDEARAALALSAQLGAPWSGPADAPPAARVLFAAFACIFESGVRKRSTCSARRRRPCRRQKRRSRKDQTGRSNLPASVIGQADALIVDAAAFETAAHGRPRGMPTPRRR